MDKARKIVIAIVCILAIIVPLRSAAQSDVQMTQYWAVPTLYNPAATGSTDWLRIRAGARLQWLGISNAPRSFLGVADMPVRLFGKQKIGVGVNLQQESLGLFSNLAVNAQLSYKIKLFKGELSIGVQPAYFNQKFKGSEVDIPEGDDFHQSGDQAIPNRDLSGNAFDLSAGIFYSHKYFWFGASALHIISPTVNLGNEGQENNASGFEQFSTELPLTAYFIGGGNIAIKNTLFEIQPSFLVRTDFTDFQAEVTVRGIYRKFLSLGVGYRWKDAISVMLGAEFKNFFLGYAYDYPLSAISKASSGSHELVAGYGIKLDFSQKNRNKHRSIRIM